MSEETPRQEILFSDLNLSKEVLAAINKIGYETPSSIQAETIPHLLEGKDLIGQAQTGTGKTAAFALPILTKIDINQRKPQVLVLAPTRELAIQVSEAFQKYASEMKGFHVLPIYGGQPYSGQLRALKRGVHVVVGTPGRLRDHLERGTLDLSTLKCLVIDEADEMLKMGFWEEVTWIMEKMPSERQTTLFSATMPPPIRKVADKHLNNPVHITIKAKTTTATTITQKYWLVSGLHKLDALTRILEGEEFDGMLVFVRTKTATTQLSEKLEARGYSCAPLNGDIPQNQRVQTLERLQSGDLDIIVATDVAARGLDVKRITHVINYDIPHDTESYVHRIGRTGRAGREGQAILFISPRERRLLQAIEKATKQKIELMQLPTREEINSLRVGKFKDRISETLAVEDLGFYYQIIEEYRQEHNIPAIEIASALARLLQGDTPFFLEKEKPQRARERSSERESEPRGNRENRKREPIKAKEGFALYRVEVGHQNQVKPGQIVGAIANEAGLESDYIGDIRIHDDHSVVELPEGMPKEIAKILRKARVCGKPLMIEPLSDQTGEKKKKSFKKGPKKSSHKPGEKKKGKKKKGRSA